MDRNNNIYGEIINSKFSYLLTARPEENWKSMKAILDTKMPEKKKKRWFFWFFSRSGIILIALSCLIASATTIFVNTLNKPTDKAIINNKEDLKQPAINDAIQSSLSSNGKSPFTIISLKKEETKKKEDRNKINTISDRKTAIVVKKSKTTTNIIPVAVEKHEIKTDLVKPLKDSILISAVNEPEVKKGF